jgi:hypothetical protein
MKIGSVFIKLLTCVDGLASAYAALISTRICRSRLMAISEPGPQGLRGTPNLRGLGSAVGWAQGL